MNNGSLTYDDVHVILDESVGENEGYRYNVKFLSLEGDDICWQKKQAEDLKQQILNNQAIVEKLKERIDDLIEGKQFYMDSSYNHMKKFEKIGEWIKKDETSLFSYDMEELKTILGKEYKQDKSQTTEHSRSKA